MHQDVPRVVALLRLLQSPADHQQAETGLDELADSTPHFLQLIKIVLVADVEDTTQLSAATYLNACLLDRLQTTQLLELLQYLSTILVDPNIKNLHKRCLDRFVVAMIAKLTPCKQRSDVDLVGELVLLTKQLYIAAQYDSAFMLLGAFAVSAAKTSEFLRYTKETYKMPLEMLASNLKHEYCMFINEWVKSMIQVMDKLTIDEDEDPTSEGSVLALEIANEPIISKIIEGTYQIGSSVGQLISMDQPLLELNLLKHQICQLQRRLISCCPDIEGTQCPTYMVANRVIPFFYNSLALIAADQSQAERYDCEDFAVAMLKVLTTLIKKSVFYNVFANLSQTLCDTVLMPLLAIAEDELHVFQESPSDFHGLAEDTCEGQTYESLKTEAAAVLDALADYIDGFTTNIIGYCLESLKFQFGKQQRPLNKVLSKEQAFMIMSILSCQISTRDDLLFEIRNFLAQSNKILPYVNKLELCRLYVFLSYNFVQLFNEELEYGTPYLESAFQKHDHPTVEFVALDFIYNQTENYCSTNLFRSLFEKALTCQVGLLWDIYQTYVTKNLKLLNQTVLVELVDCLYRRVAVDLAKIRQKQMDNSLILIKSLNVVKEIVRVSGYLSDKPFLSERIWSIIEVLQHIKQIEFEDDVLEILNGILEQKQEFGEREMTLLPFVELIFNKYKGVYNILFRTINLFINHSQLVQEAGPVLTLLKLCVRGLSPTYEKFQHEDVGEALLLLQLLISRTRRILSKTTLTEVAVEIKKVISAIDSGIVRARALNVLVQMYPCIDTRQAFPIIVARQNEFSGYDRTVLIVGLCSVMMEQSNPAIIAQVISIAVGQLSIEASKLNDKKPQPSEKLKILAMNKKPSRKRKYKADASFLKSIDTLESPWKKLDKFEYLQKTLQTMRKNNEHMYNVLIEQLSEQTRLALREVGSVHCVSNRLRKIIKVRRDVFKEDIGAVEENSEMVDERAKARQDLDDEDGNKGQRKRKKQQGKSKHKKKTKTS